MFSSNDNLTEMNRTGSIDKALKINESKLKFVSDLDEENNINCLMSEGEFKYKEGFIRLFKPVEIPKPKIYINIKKNSRRVWMDSFGLCHMGLWLSNSSYDEL